MKNSFLACKEALKSNLKQKTKGCTDLLVDYIAANFGIVGHEVFACFMNKGGRGQLTVLLQMLVLALRQTIKNKDAQIKKLKDEAKTGASREGYMSTVGHDIEIAAVRESWKRKYEEAFKSHLEEKQKKQRKK